MVHSEMQAAEKEIRSILEFPPGQAMTGIIQAYHRRSQSEKDTFVIVLAARIATASALSSASSDGA